VWLRALAGRIPGGSVRGMVDVVDPLGDKFRPWLALRILRNNSAQAARSYGAAGPTHFTATSSAGARRTVDSSSSSFSTSYSGLRQRPTTAKHRDRSARATPGDFLLFLRVNDPSQVPNRHSGNQIQFRASIRWLHASSCSLFPAQSSRQFAQIRRRNPFDSDEVWPSRLSADLENRLDGELFATHGSELQPFVGGMANLPWASQVSTAAAECECSETFTFIGRTPSADQSHIPSAISAPV